MEKFIQQERDRILELQDLFEQALDSHFNLHPHLTPEEKWRMKWFLKNAIHSEIDFLHDDPTSYKSIYYEE
jgi:hypothetical protein